MRRVYDEPPTVRPGLRAAAGVMDFLGIILCTLFILALMSLMTALFSWLKGDLTATFSGIGQNINDAVMIDADGDR